MPLRNLNKKTQKRARSTSREPNKEIDTNNNENNAISTTPVITENTEPTIKKETVTNTLNSNKNVIINNINFKGGDRIKVDNKEGIIISTKRLGCNAITIKYNDNSNQIFFGKNRNKIIKL